VGNRVDGYTCPLVAAVCGAGKHPIAFVISTGAGGSFHLRQLSALREISSRLISLKGISHPASYALSQENLTRGFEMTAA